MLRGSTAIPEEYEAVLRFLFILSRIANTIKSFSFYTWHFLPFLSVVGAHSRP